MPLLYRSDGAVATCSLTLALLDWVALCYESRVTQPRLDHIVFVFGAEYRFQAALLHRILELKAHFDLKLSFCLQFDLTQLA